MVDGFLVGDVTRFQSSVRTPPTTRNRCIVWTYGAIGLLLLVSFEPSSPEPFTPWADLLTHNVILLAGFSTAERGK